MIDIHTHLAFHKVMSPGFIRGIIGSLANQSGLDQSVIVRLVENSLQDSDCSKLIAQMDEAGIDRSILLIADYGYALGEADFPIEKIHELHAEILRKFPDRLLVFAGVDPRRGISGIKLVEQAIENYGFSGLKLYPPCGFELDDESLMPYYEICDDRKIPILTHTGPSLETMKTEKRYPRSAIKISNRFPRIPLVLAHAGARDIKTTKLIIREGCNIYCDISGFQKNLGNAWTGFKDELVELFRAFPDRVIFGSDWPLFCLGGSQKRWLHLLKNELSLKKNEFDMLFDKNAKFILKI